MKSNLVNRLFCCLTICFLLAGAFPASANNTAAVDEAQALIDGIVGYKQKQTGASTIQQWIDGALAQNAGRSSEWYVLALSQSGRYDFSAYQAALLRYLNQNDVPAAASRQKYALVLIATGSSDAYIRRTLNDSIGQQGVMSWIYGLHLLNNGYHSDQHTLSSVTKQLLSLQLSDGGWAVMGQTSDVDVTAMAVQALAPRYSKDTAVKSAVDKALRLLSTRQLATGDYASYGVGNPESTAQVMVALSSLGIDGERDTRFIKDGHTLLDGIQKYRLSDGSFCHKLGGSANETATVQSFYALVSYRRMVEGKSALYMLDRRNPAGLASPVSSTAAVPATVSPPPTQAGTPRPGTSTAKPANGSTPSPTRAAEDGSSGTTNPRSPSGTLSTGSSRLGQTSVSSGGISKTAILSTEKSRQGAPAADAGQQPPQTPYKVWVCLGIFLVGGMICLFLYVTKRRNIKNFITIIVVTAIAAGAVCLTNIQSVDEFYNSDSSVSQNAVGQVTICIRCDTIAGKSDAAYIPQDGVLLPSSTMTVEEGDTVFDVLTKAAKKDKLLIDSSGAGESVYIKGIGQIYEFDFGDLSGWMYFVNGQAPSVGCGEYRPADGDVIEWRYTCDLGHDLS